MLYLLKQTVGLRIVEKQNGRPCLHVSAKTARRCTSNRVDNNRRSSVVVSVTGGRQVQGKNAQVFPDSASRVRLVGRPAARNNDRRQRRARMSRAPFGYARASRICDERLQSVGDRRRRTGMELVDHN